MPIPKATEAVVEIEKVRDYLLNPDHPEGKSKAVWFESLNLLQPIRPDEE